MDVNTGSLGLNRRAASGPALQLPMKPTWPVKCPGWSHALWLHTAVGKKM